MIETCHYCGLSKRPIADEIILKRTLTSMMKTIWVPLCLWYQLDKAYCGNPYMKQTSKRTNRENWSSIAISQRTATIWYHHTGRNIYQSSEPNVSSYGNNTSSNVAHLTGHKPVFPSSSIIILSLINIIIPTEKHGNGIRHATKLSNNSTIVLAHHSVPQAVFSIMTRIEWTDIFLNNRV